MGRDQLNLAISTLMEGHMCLVKANEEPKLNTYTTPRNGNSTREGGAIAVQRLYNKHIIY